MQQTIRKTRVISDYLGENHDTRPAAEQIDAHIRELGLAPEDAGVLRAWQGDQEDGRTITDHCSCGNLVVSPDEEHRLNMTACDGCQQNVCDQCHQHVPGPREEKCLCGECAQRQLRDQESESE